MRYSIAFAAMAAVAQAQTVSIWTIETTVPEHPADALDLAAIAAQPDPTYTETPGLTAQDIPYATATAIQSAAAVIVEEPLTVFPAATSVAMNAEGESSSSGAAATGTAVVKRDLLKRTACAPQATLANTYNVDLSSYDAFKADASIASVANAAATPVGYYQNSKNLKGAQSAYAYLGYIQVPTYNVQTCADKCNKKTGCLGFNIFFERDPVVEPGFGANNCENPAPFANIKCSFWGSILEDKTATNVGQWQSKFQVAIAGSNSYTSYKTGGPIDGAGLPLSLDNAVMNAPLRDCRGTWTYMGYKLLTDGPFDSRLCKAACDAQTQYNRDHPPTNGDNLAICSGFGSYLLTMTNKTSSYPQGQMCTFYTSGWGKQYAVNTASYNDAIGAKYTYSSSYFYNITALQPVCPSPNSCSKPFSCYSGTGAQVCSTARNSVACFANTAGAGLWAADESCEAYLNSRVCSKDSDCASTDFCATKTCCGDYARCIPKTTCANPLVASRMFRKDVVPAAKRDDGCVDTTLRKCPTV